MAVHQTNQALLACQTEERHREKDSAWHQLIEFIQSALWMWEIHSETKCLCYDYRQSLACQWKCLQQEVLSKWDISMLLKYENSLFIIKSNTQTTEDYISVLNRNTSLAIHKLLLLLIFPFPKLWMVHYSDSLKSTQKRYSLQEVLVDIYAISADSVTLSGVWTKS